jgi:transglutaminase-like putative cysteine protease
MWRMRVVHSTGYAYKSPATASYNEARLTPRSDNRQNVILSRVETVPPTRSCRYVDYWGTAVTAFDLHAPHTELEVTASSVVETDKPEPPTKTVTWHDLGTEAVVDRFDEVLTPTKYVPENKRLQSVGKRLAKDHTPEEAVIAASHWVHNELDYVAGTTGVHSSAVDALRENKGVCQDFAHLTLLLLRSMGIPSHYVSGYLHPKRKAAIGDTIEGAEPRVDPGLDRRLAGLRPHQRQRDQRAVRERRCWPRLRRCQPAQGHLLGPGVHGSGCHRRDHPARVAAGTSTRCESSPNSIGPSNR